MQYSVVNYKMVKENSDFRIDGEYYHPSFLDLESKIENLKNEPFGNLVKEIRCGPFGSTVLKDTYLDDGVIVARPFNLINYSLERGNLVFIDEADLKKGLRVYQEGDIFFSRVGDVHCGIVPKFDKKITISPNIIAVKVKKEKVNPYFATIFFNSKYGFPQIVRGLKVVAQPTIQTDLVAKLRIVVPSSGFQEIIENLFVKSLSLQDNSKFFYSQAEQLLLSELELLEWKPKRTLSFIKNFSNTIESDRFDAEYFQPKYEEIVEAIKKYKGGFDELGSLVKIKKSVEPGSEAYQENGIPFVRVSNLSKFELSDNNQQFISEELYDELKTHQPKKGEILLSKDATPGMAYYLNEETQKMIVSGGILKLKMDSKQILPEYLTLVLNSVIVQKQIERDAGGSIINHWRPDQVKATLIPILKNDKQGEIKALVEKSFNDRKLSKSLLEIAKRGVEMAIEKDEQEAEKWINSEVDGLVIKI